MRGGAECEPYEVRNHEPDEADGAALDDGARRQKPRDNHDDEAPARKIESQALRRGFTGREHVEGSRDEQDDAGC